MITTTANGEQKIQLYSAILTQTGTNNPTATILQNEIGNIVWTRSEEGSYAGVLTDAFPENRTFITCNSDAEVGALITLAGYGASNFIRVWNYGNGTTPSDGMTAYIEIRIYNN